MTGSGHDQQTREPIIKDGSMVLGAPFTGLDGILTGQTSRLRRARPRRPISPPTASAVRLRG